jgi:hypothetical protein
MKSPVSKIYKKNISPTVAQMRSDKGSSTKSEYNMKAVKI